MLLYKPTDHKYINDCILILTVKNCFHTTIFYYANTKAVHTLYHGCLLQIRIAYYEIIVSFVVIYII